MKIHYILGIMAVILLLALSGCGTGEVVNDVEDSAETTEEVEETTEEVDNKELIKQLTEEAGLDTEEAVEEEAEEEEAVEEETTETSDAKQEVILENLKGSPEDFDLYVGDAVKITNKEVGFKHVVEIWEKVDGSWVKKAIDGKHELLPGDSYEYTFEKAGRFKWLSLTRYPDASGEITVISK